MSTTTPNASAAPPPPTLAQLQRTLKDTGLLSHSQAWDVAEIVLASFAPPCPPIPTPPPTIDDVLADRGTSSWLRRALGEALNRDIVKAANDAELLARLLVSRCDGALAAVSRGASASPSHLQRE